MQNIDLTEKSETLYNIKIYTKMGKEVLTFWLYWDWKK